MKIEILVDSQEFWKNLEADVLSAKDAVLVQTLSFEGDRIGKQLTDLLLSSKASDRRLIVDSYTRFVLSDKFLYTPRNLLNKDLRQEVSETYALIARLNRNGVQAKFINPAGPLLIHFARRNHKKIITVDDTISYIGGINFSEHNFYWHDMMLRIEDADITTFLKEDFLATWDGQSLAHSKQFGGIHFHLLNGHSNETVFSEIFDLMDAAKERIFIETPYLTFPFTEKLRDLREKGIAVTIIVPEVNNWMGMDQYNRWEAIRSGFDVRLYTDRLTHLKTMLIDDTALIVGSSNFDYLSYRSQEELIAVITDKDIISRFNEKVVKTDLSHSIKFEGRVHPFIGYLFASVVKTTLKLYILLDRL